MIQDVATQGVPVHIIQEAEVLAAAIAIVAGVEGLLHSFGY